MVLTLLDLVAPGVGRPVGEALKLIFGAASEMQESSELCKRVHEHLQFLYSKLDAMERKGTLPGDDILTKYGRLVGEYCAFLEKHRHRIWIYRVVLYKHVLNKVRDFQQDVATLMLALNMCHMDAAADERAAMAAFREQQARTIATRLTNDATIAREVADETQLVEALSVLQYELQAHASPGGGVARPAPSSVPPPSAPPPAVQLDLFETVLHTALDKVMRRSSVRVDRLPDWFLPQHKVEYNPQAFARGSFGTVHHGTMGFADVVVKCLLIDTRGNESVTSRFRHEAGLWYSFRHKHVLTMYGACDVSSPPFIVCERAAHGNLFNFVSKESNRRMTFRLLRDAASGLAYLHGQRVVHGDLKCDNILVTDGYVVKVADFSFSYVRTLSASKRSAAGASGGIRTSSGGVSTAGALRWRAPECLKGRRPTFASDVFSLGMCIIEAVSHEVPWSYDVADDNTVWNLVTSGELPEQPKAMTDRVWTLVKRMCSFEPANRPSMDLVVAELSALARDEAAAASAPAAPPPPATGWHREAPWKPAATPSPSPAPFALPLEQAIEQDNVACVSSLLVSTASLEAPVAGWDAVPLVVAAATGAINVTQMLLTRGASVYASVTKSPRLHWMDDTGYTALHVAAQTGHSDVVDALLTAKPTAISVLTAKQRSAMYFAARFGHAAVVEKLVRHGADLGRCEVGTRKSALSVAAEFGHLECVSAVLRVSDSNINAKSTDGSTALHQAAANGHDSVISTLLLFGARVNESDNDGDTPLHYAALFGHAACARVLLQRRANVHARLSSGSTALHQAAAKGHDDVIAELLKFGARVDERDAEGGTPLHWAAMRGHLTTAKLLLQRNAAVNAKNSRGVAAMHRAAAQGHVAIITELLRNRADVDELDTSRSTPLHWAASNGQLECVRFLLHKGASVLKKTDVGTTALHQAVANGHTSVASLLLQSGARVNEPDNDGDTPLLYAALYGHAACAQVLLQNKANVRAQLASGSMAIHQAAAKGHDSVIVELLKFGAGVDDRDASGGTPLHWAVRRGRFMTTRFLLQRKASVNARDKQGATPLQLAFPQGSVDIIHLLISAGAVNK